MKLLSFLNKFKYVILSYVIFVILTLIEVIINPKNFEIWFGIISLLFLVSLIIFHPKNISNFANHFSYVIYSYLVIVTILILISIVRMELITFSFSKVILLLVSFPKCVHSVITLIKVKSNDLNFRLRFIFPLSIFILSLILIVWNIPIIIIIYTIVSVCLGAFDCYLLIQAEKENASI